MRLQSSITQPCPKYHLTPRLAQSQVTDNGQETSSESETSNKEEDAPCDDEDAEADKGDVEVLSDRQAASDGNEGQGHTLSPC